MRVNECVFAFPRTCVSGCLNMHICVRVFEHLNGLSVCLCDLKLISRTNSP